MSSLPTHDLSATGGSRDDAALDAVAAEIRRHAATALLAFADAVGRLVLDRLYGGDERAWRYHGPKDASLRRLSERLGDLEHFSASRLYSYVAIHAVLRRLGGTSRWQHLTPSHVRAVLPLPERDQALVLREAEIGKWSVRQVEARARATSRPRRGRPRTPTFVRALGRMEALLADDGMAFQEIDRIAGLDPDSVAEIHARLVRLQERLDRLRGTFNPKRLGAGAQRGRFAPR